MRRLRSASAHNDAAARASARGSNALKCVLLAALLAMACAVSAVLGASSVGLSDLIALACGDTSDAARNILMNVRLPRVAAAALAGCALAAAGAVIQGVLNNPLASPNVIGVNSGAGFAVLVVSAFAPGAAAFLPAAAFAGALATAGVIFAISMRSRASKLVVVLAGMALTTIFGAGMNAILIVDPDAYVGSSMFLVGGLSGVKFSELAWPAAYVAAGLMASLCLSRVLDVLSLGDAAAHGLGVNVAASRIACLAVAAMLAGAAVSFAGLIGFVGLVVPHIARHFVGSRSRDVIAASALLGSLFVVVCDSVARCAFAPYELPVGILLALIGGPFFIYLILRKGGAHGE